MPNNIVDTLEVKITANALTATEALTSLSDALKKVRKQLDGAKEADHLAKSLNAMNGALNTINTSGIKRLQKFANALNDYADACRRIKDVGAITQNIKNAANALSATETATKADTTQDTMATSAGGESTIKKRLSLMEKLRYEYQKATQKISEFDKKIGESNSFLTSFWNSIKRIAFYRAIRSALKAIGEAFETGLKNAYGFSKQDDNFKRLADTLDRIKSVTSQMVNQIGAFWGEVKQFILPAVEWIVEKVRQLSEGLTELFAALNGEATYLQAQYVATAWNDATDAVKKYKGQLLGLDELNNLTTGNSGKKDETDYSKLYKEVAVSTQALDIAKGWLSFKEKLDEAFDGIYGSLIAPIGMAAIGAILLFTGHAFLGLGLLVAGVAWGVSEIMMNWDAMREDVAEAFQKYEGLFAALAVGLTAVGAILLFVPGHFLLGISLLLAGGALGVATVAFNWSKIRKRVEKAFEKFRGLFAALAIGLTAVGAILLFIPGHILLGISLLLAGGLLGAATVAFSWDGLRKDVQKAFEDNCNLLLGLSLVTSGIGAVLLFVPGYQLLGISLLVAGGLLGAATVAFNWTKIKQDVEDAFTQYRGLFAAAGAVTMLAGILFLFTGNLAWGLGLLIGGGMLLGSTIAFNWDSILEGLQDAWKNIKIWWNNTVVNSIKKAVGWVEDQLHWDLNKDGTIGSGNISTIETSGGGNIHGGSSFKFGEGSGSSSGTSSSGSSSGNVVFDLGYSLGEKVREGLSRTWDRITDTFSWDATGAIERPGSLFYAGESGPEFVGAMGHSSAVANTGQMTDAIYKAAYMGMSRALAENGGGLGGFEPATTDDLFIAMRKKASNYNKMTGNSAFA